MIHAYLNRISLAILLAFTLLVNSGCGVQIYGIRTLTTSRSSQLIGVRDISFLTLGFPVPVQANGVSNQPDYSSDGNWMVFTSAASNLILNDGNFSNDIFLKNLTTGVIERISTNAQGGEVSGDSEFASFSPDGGSVVFSSNAPDLVPGDTNGAWDIFIKNLSTGVVSRVSTSTGGGEGNADSRYGFFSPDGSLVAFRSQAFNLVPGDTNGKWDIFIKNLASGTTVRVSTDALGVEGNGDSTAPTFSPDGSMIGFASESTNLVPGDTNSVYDAFVKNLSTGAIDRVSTSSGGVEGDATSGVPFFSPDGTQVAFTSGASNLVVGDTNGADDIFVKTLATGAIDRISTTSGNAEANFGASGVPPVFSPDGNGVAFVSPSTNLVAGDTNNAEDVFVKNLTTGAIGRTSTSAGSVEGDGNSNDVNLNSLLRFSPDGSALTYVSDATNLVVADTNSVTDIFTKSLFSNAILRESRFEFLGPPNTPWTPNGGSDHVVVSADGHLMAFQSDASNLVVGDTNGVTDIFVKNLTTGLISRVSTSVGGIEGDGYSSRPSFSSDGNFVVFESYAGNLVAGDNNGRSDIFVKNLANGVIERVSTTSAGVQSNHDSLHGSFSPDGNLVLFDSRATNLVAGDTNAAFDVFTKNLTTGATTRISTSSVGAQANGFSDNARFSPDGNSVAFMSTASNLVAGDTNFQNDIFVKNLTTGEIQLISTSTQGVQGNMSVNLPVFSPDGKSIAFFSDASNLVSGDTNGITDIFLKNLVTGVLERVSVSGVGGQSNGASYFPVFSPDGNSVAFSSGASNLISGDTNGKLDIFVKNLKSGAVVRVSTSASGVEGDGASDRCYFAGDGSSIFYLSTSTNLENGGLTGALKNIFRAILIYD